LGEALSLSHRKTALLEHVQQLDSGQARRQVIVRDHRQPSQRRRKVRKHENMAMSCASFVMLRSRPSDGQERTRGVGAGKCFKGLACSIAANLVVDNKRVPLTRHADQKKALPISTKSTTDEGACLLARQAHCFVRMARQPTVVQKHFLGVI
jgi:hypothetical protein